MPAKSAAQKRLMDAAAHSPAFAKKVGIPSKVAKEFSKESKGMTFQKGGEMKKDSKAMAKKEIAFMQKKGAPKSMIKHEKAEYGMKSGGKAYRLGGMAASSAKLGPVMRGAKAGAGMGGLEKEESPQRTKPMNMKSGGKAYAKGGGVEVKGKTKGKIIKMAGGGRGC